MQNIVICIGQQVTGIVQTVYVYIFVEGNAYILLEISGYIRIIITDIAGQIQKTAAVVIIFLNEGKNGGEQIIFVVFFCPILCGLIELIAEQI